MGQMRSMKLRFNNSAMRGGRLLTRWQLIVSLLLMLCVVFLPVPALLQTLAYIAVAAMITVVLLLPLVIRVARRLGVVDMPGGRRIHALPTPRWGGIGVAVGVFAALLVASPNFMPNLRALLLSSTLVLLIGLADDMRPMPAWFKLLAQMVACSFLIMDGVHVLFVPATWWGIPLRWLITMVWVVGITNAVNFLDGMDGLVTGLVIGTSVIYLGLAMLLGSPMLAYCATAIFGAAFGFLGYNMRPARVFLGDGGSTFLGFFLAALSVQGSWAKNNPMVSFFIPVLVLSVPIYDMVFTTVARIASGKVRSFREWVEYTGRDHFHHRLEWLGLTRGQVVLAIWFLNFAVGLGAITLFESATYGGIALLAQAACIYLVIALLEVLGARRLDRIRNKGEFNHSEA